MDYKLGAVAKIRPLVGFQKIGVNCHRIDLSRVNWAADASQSEVNRRPGAALQRLQHSADNCHNAQPAGIHYAGSFQRRQLFRSAGQRRHGGIVSGLPQKQNILPPGVIVGSNRLGGGPYHG